MPETTAPDTTTAGIPLSPLERSLGIEMHAADPDRVVATMPVQGNTQPFGALHGGASCVLAEMLGSVGACLHFGASGRSAVGVELVATHHRAVRSGRVAGVATPLHRGGRLATYAIEITDERGERVCSARLVAMATDMPAGVAA